MTTTPTPTPTTTHQPHRRRQAFVFIKPHAVTDAVKGLVSEQFAARNITVLSEGAIAAESIDEKKLIDQHYYAIASKATILKPSELNVTVVDFTPNYIWYRRHEDEQPRRRPSSFSSSRWPPP